MKEIKVYGIANCDIIKKTLNWFAKHNIRYAFHDYKKLGIESDKLKHWIEQAGLLTVMNKRSTTWRELAPEVQSGITDEKEAIKIMQEHNSIIKRPVIEYNGKIIVGYDEGILKNLFETKK